MLERLFVHANISDKDNPVFMPITEIQAKEYEDEVFSLLRDSIRFAAKDSVGIDEGLRLRLSTVITDVLYEYAATYGLVTKDVARIFGYKEEDS